MTLLNVIWSTTSKQTVALTGMAARNNDINRALEKGQPVTSLLPLVRRVQCSTKGSR